MNILKGNKKIKIYNRQIKNRAKCENGYLYK